MRKVTLITVIAALFIVLISIPAYIYLSDIIDPLSKIRPEQSLKKRILIVAPHPDDESLAAAGIIRRAASNNDSVRLIMMTCGDSFLKAAQIYTRKNNPFPSDFKKLGQARRKETLQAVSYLGLSVKDVRFLGYPDGGTIFLWTNYWDYNNPRISGGVRVDRVPYDFAVKKGALYCGQSIVDALTKEIEDFKPTEIYYPINLDEHPDHWAAGAFVKYILCQKNLLNITQRSYLVHRSLWPQPFLEEPQKLLLPPGELVNLAKWVDFPLANDEIKKKKGALHLYPTQETVMEPFLWAFVRRTELFAVESPIVIDKAKNVSSASAREWGEIKDPRADTVSRLYNGSVDLSSLRTAIDNNKIRFNLVTRKNISPQANYFIEAKFFKENKTPQQLACIIRNNKIFVKKVSKNSITGKVINFSIKGNAIDFIIASDELKGIKTILVGARSQYKEVKDRTDLKVFTLQHSK